MTLVDPSALVAILLDEPDKAYFISKLRSANQLSISIVGKVEAVLAVGKAIGDYAAARNLVQQAVDAAGILTVGVAPELFDEIIDSYVKYGKGTGHRAKLNFGDCFSHALSRRHRMPLLFKGDDFNWTDVTTA